MATFHEALHAYLTRGTDLKTFFKDGIYNDVLAQGTSYPALTWQVVDDRDVQRFDGVDDDHPVSVQFDVWALNGADRREGARRVRLAMLRFHGKWADIDVTRPMKDSDFDSTWERGDAAATPGSRNTQRWTVWICDPSLTS